MIVRPPLTMSAIEQSASDFRDRYAPGVTGGIDFEHIIEFALGLELVPEPNLIGRMGVYGCLGMDGKTIFVDEGFQRGAPREEYNALLAHEIAHWELHRWMLPRQFPKSKEDYVKYHTLYSAELRAQIEKEARRWGRAARMPKYEVMAAFIGAVEAASDRFPRLRGSAGARLFIETKVAEHFEVAVEHAENRIHDLRLMKTLPRTPRIRISRRASRSR